MNSIFGQNAPVVRPEGLALSDDIFKKLNAAGFSAAKKVPLAPAFGNFPYNIELEFFSKKSSAYSENLIIAATQEDAFENFGFLTEFLKFAQNADFKYNTTFLFTAGDARKILGNEETCGTEIFCRNLEGSKNKHALVFDFGASKNNYVVAGSSGKISPLYLTQPLCDSLSGNSVEHALFGGMYLSLYMLGIFKSDARLSSFLAHEIPAVMLRFIPKKENYGAELNSLKDFLVQIKFPAQDSWNHYYVPLKIGSKTFWLGEKRILIIIMIFTALCLFYLSDFSFLFRKRSRRLVKVKSHALKSTYLIFLTAAILALSLYIGQILIRALLGLGVENLVVLFIIKISSPFFIISIIYPWEIKFHKDLPPYIYEYILSVSALLNVFIFSMINVILFFLFALEFFILAISRIVKKAFLLYFFMALFLLPFVPLLYSILIYSDGRKIFELIFCTTRENVLLSFALVPLSLLWLRVLARLNYKTESRGKLIAWYFISSAASVAGIAIITIVAISALNKLFFKTVEIQNPFVQVENSNENIFAKVAIIDNQYYGGKIRSIEISSIKDAERYSIFVQGKNANSVYYSIYETAYENGRTEFLLPENPPRNLKVLYTPDSSENSIITVEAYFLDVTGEKCQKEIFVFDSSQIKTEERQAAAEGI